MEGAKAMVVKLLNLNINQSSDTKLLLASYWRKGAFYHTANKKLLIQVHQYIPFKYLENKDILYLLNLDTHEKIFLDKNV